MPFAKLSGCHSSFFLLSGCTDGQLTEMSRREKNRAALAKEERRLSRLHVFKLVRAISRSTRGSGQSQSRRMSFN